MGERSAAGDVFVQSLARGLDVITAFSAERPTMSLTEVATATGLSRASARRFLLTLEQLGYVRTDGKTFSLTPQILRLGTAYLSSLELPQIAQPHLDRLSAEVGQSASVAVLDGPDIVYVARAAKPAIMTVGISVGTRFPAIKTSMGRVLLAALPREEMLRRLGLTDDAQTNIAASRAETAFADQLVRVVQQGWASTDESLAPGLRSVAMPLRDASGEVVAAINVSSTTEHDPVAEYLPALRDAAAAVSSDLQAQHRG